MARRILEKCGCEVTIAHNGIEAIARTTEHTYDLVLMDCHMPLMGGFEATRGIRAAEAAGERMPVVALTASVLDADRQECLASGMDAVLAKPIAHADLAQLVQARTRRPARWPWPTRVEGSSRRRSRGQRRGPE